ncbi:MAG: NrsF family protein [Rickettsiales bacterium]
MDTDSLIDKLSVEKLEPPLPDPIIMASKWIFVTITYFAFITVFFGLRSDIAIKIRESDYIFDVSVMFIAATSAMIAASFLALPDSGQKGWVRFIPLIPTLIIAFFLIKGVTHENSMSMMDCLKKKEYECMASILIFSSIMGVFIFAAIRKAAPTLCCWAGSMAALSIASFSYIMLRLIDIHDDPMVLMIWHFIPVFIVTVAGMFLGKIFLKRSSLATN